MTDRETLTAHMTAFLAALALRSTQEARLSADVRYTENGQPLAIGDGAWGTVTELGTYRHDFVDTESGIIASMATIAEGHTRSILVTRLAVRDDSIAEIECFAARPDVMTGGGLFAQGPASLDESGGPDPHWAAPVPEGERLRREDLRHIANLYFAGLEKNDGKGIYPFADDCIRIENGFRTTGSGVTASEGAAPHRGGADSDTPYRLDFKKMTAKQQFETGYFAFVDRIRHRRFPVIDVERGIVFALAFFDHSGTVRDYSLADGTRVTSSVERPFTWQIGEAFKIERRLLTRIEAVMTACPYGMPSGWPMLEGDIA